MNDTLSSKFNQISKLMTESLIDTGIRILPYIELTIGVPCIICNLYFAFRFSQISTINPNLKVLLIMTNLLSAVIALLHPIIAFVPTEFYSVEDGCVFGACVFYALCLFNHSCILMLDFKFVMILIERRYAFKYRAEYEKQDSSIAINIIFMFFIFTVIIILIRVVAILSNHDVNQPIDDLFETAFIAERSPSFFATVHVAPAASSILGVYELTRLVSLTKKYKYLGTTLSESFEIKQTANVIQILKPLIYIYCSLTFIALISYSCLLYFHYVQGYSVKSPLYIAISNMDYLCASSYTLFATAYMIFAFHQLRRIFFNDLGRILCINVQTDRICPREVDKSRQTNDHFDYLKEVWQSG